MDRLKIEILSDIGYKYYDWNTDQYLGITFDDVKRAVSNYKGDNIDVYINSYGGDLLQANAIHTILKGHKANVTAHVIGYAMSAATVIAIAADTITMSNNGYFMIHNPMNGVYGDINQQSNNVELLEKVTDQLAKVYVNRTGIDYERIRSMMDKETWLNATEALELGFVDSLTEGIDIAASYKVENFKNFKHTPKEVLNHFSKPLIMENTGDKNANPMEAVMNSIAKGFDDLKAMFNDKKIDIEPITNQIKNSFTDMKAAFDAELADIKNQFETFKSEQADVSNFVTKEDLKDVKEAIPSLDNSKIEEIHNTLKSVSQSVGDIMNQKGTFKAANQDVGEIDTNTKVFVNKPSKSKYSSQAK